MGDNNKNYLILGYGLLGRDISNKQDGIWISQNVNKIILIFHDLSSTKINYFHDDNNKLYMHTFL